MLAIGVPLVVGAGMMMVDDERAENKKRETQSNRTTVSSGPAFLTPEIVSDCRMHAKSLYSGSSETGVNSGVRTYWSGWVRLKAVGLRHSVLYLLHIRRIRKPFGSNGELMIS